MMINELIQITRQEYEERLSVLPPLDHSPFQGMEIFFSSEFWHGAYTQMYAKVNAKRNLYSDDLGCIYFTRKVNYDDDTTWIRHVEVKNVADSTCKTMAEKSDDFKLNVDIYNSQFIPPCSYDVGEKLTTSKISKHPDFVKARESLGYFNVVGVRKVLADRVAYLTVKVEGEESFKEVTINQRVKSLWVKGKIHCFHRYYTYGDDVITTLNHDDYLARLTEWQKHKFCIEEGNNNE